MIKRRTLAVAAATTLLSGLGAYGAATAFASPSDPTPQPTSSATASPKSDGMDRDAMIRHCTKGLPAGERASAERHMREMLSAHGSEAEHSQMDDHSGTSMSGMGGMGGNSTESMTGMMGATEDGS
ncbi:hypothetical protein [Streptomyces sp. NPDC001435]|uniref:hypothetical protein n=1 Tax=unclassified Streptomyces TaxID=2593676 RepID=UPI0036C4E7B7